MTGTCSVSAQQHSNLANLQRTVYPSELVFGAMPGLAEYAEIALPVAVRGTFTYAIPAELRDGVRLGSRVEVPFGAKRSTGFVVGLPNTAPKAAKIKHVRAVL